jgi:hypothetical protein
MSIITTAGNYGGRVVDNQQGVKQFYISNQSIASWIYKKMTGGLLVQTPANKKIPVLINSDVIITGSIYNTSDEKLKHNINNIPKEFVDNIFTLNPMTFTYKNDENSKTHYGVLAQDVEKVYPNLVKEDVTGFKTVNYQELIPLMLAKMKVMQHEIDELKNNKA